MLKPSIPSGLTCIKLLMLLIYHLHRGNGRGFATLFSLVGSIVGSYRGKGWGDSTID